MTSTRIAAVIPFLGGLLFLALSNPVSHAEDSGPRCMQYLSALRGRTVKYCIDRSRPDLPATSGEPVAYYFHGVGRDEGHWSRSRYDQTLRELRRTEDLPAVTFVSFETAGTSFFADREASGEHAYETWFLREFVPMIEARYRVCSTRRCRALLGHSMGGMGAINTGLRHPHLFFLIGANSPATPPFNVFDDYGKVWRPYFQRHGVLAARGAYLIWDARRAFKSRENADAHSPIELVRGFPASKRWPAFYVDVGDDDYYGFDEGVGILVRLLAERGLPATSNLYRGGTHDIEDEPMQRRNLLRFLFDRLK